MSNTQILIMWAIVGVIFILVLSNALDRSMDNKDRMLCASSKVSGNEVYLNKCICYFRGEDIRCIYKEK